MTERWRRPVVCLAVVVSTAGCSGDGRELRPPPGYVEGRVITIDLLSSPENAVAELFGSGAVESDPVTVDGRPAVVESFAVEAEGGYRIRVRIEEEGAHTVCVADVCGRVFTLAPDAETPEEVVARIDEALTIAATIVPYAEWFPDWTVEIGGAMSGTGGTTDASRQVVTVHRNRGRSVDDFVRTILHEFGHVVDLERLDDAERTDYTVVAGYPVDTPWSDPTARSIDEWASQPSEDFAEVLVASWSAGRWMPRTREGLPDELVERVRALAGSDVVPSAG